jgi:ketosteroid isomerase-like protein
MNGVTANRVAQDLEQSAKDWATAERNGDTAFMQRTLTDDFEAIGPRGFMLNKEQWLQRFQSGSLQYEYLEWDEVTVRPYGDAAVVTGRERQKVNYQGQPMESDLRTTLVWVKQNGRWLLANAQMSPILGMPQAR